MKTLIVYMHLIAACIAVGIIFMQDLSLIKTRGSPLSAQATADLKQAATIISSSLTALWISGVLLVVIGYIDNPQQYLLNQKLWAKFSVVLILTLNGMALHRFSFPRVVSTRGILGLGVIEKTLVVFTGTVSTISWLFSCYLGVARPWNHTVEFSFVMFVYLGLLTIACIFGCTIIHFFKEHRPPAAQPGPVIQRNPDIRRSPSRHMIPNPIPLAERISKM